MALIGKIRNNMWLVIVLLAMALIAFVLMDMVSASNRGSFGSQTLVGEVNGSKIDYLDFQRTEEALYGGSTDVNGRKTSVWNYYVEKSFLDNLTEQTGIDVGKDELAELEFGNNLSPVVQSFYRNPQTGQVDRAQLDEIKKAIDENTVTNTDFAMRFNELRKQVIKSQKQTKLNNLVAKSFYTPKWYAETMDKLNSATINMEYVYVPYTNIADDQIVVSDEEIAAYIKENEKKYTSKEEVRNISYISYDVTASKEDSLALYGELSALVTEFKETDNDSLITATNEGFYPNAYAKVDELSGLIKDTVKYMAKGDVFGPYIDNGAYFITKLVDKKVMPDSAKASHILRSVNQGDPLQLAAANKYIDSLKTAIQSGALSFSDAATNNSQDPGSAAKGGDLGTFAPGMMVREFNDAVFNGTQGQLYKVITQFGVHLIKVEKLIYKTNELKYNLAYIYRPIVPSEETQNAALDQALEVLEKTKTIADLTALESVDNKVQLVSNIKRNDHILGALGSDQSSRDIIKWAFDEDTEVGQVSSTLYSFRDQVNYVDSKHVIAALKSVNAAGLGTPETLRSTVEPLVRNKKKADIIKGKISGADLTSIASVFETEVKTADNISFGRPSLPEIGVEPLVIGKAFAQEVGNTSAPIEGKNGVFVVKTNAFTPPSTEAGAIGQRIQLTQNARSQVNFRLMESIKKNLKIEDRRSKYF